MCRILKKLSQTCWTREIGRQKKVTGRTAEHVFKSSALLQLTRQALLLLNPAHREMKLLSHVFTRSCAMCQWIIQSFHFTPGLYSSFLADLFSAVHEWRAPNIANMQAYNVVSLRIPPPTHTAKNNLKYKLSSGSKFCLKPIQNSQST